MPRPKGSTKTPRLTLHRASGRAVVRIDGRDHYCGAHGTPEAKREYDRLIGEWLVRGRQSEPAARAAGGGVTVTEVIAAFWEHARTYYSGCVRDDGKVVGELDNFRLAMRPLRRLYGTTTAAKFGPVALKSVRATMISTEYRGARWSRRYVNRQVGRIKHVFKWAAEHELLPPSVYHGLAAVAGLRAGRSDAREAAPVRPVAEQDVDAVRPLVSAHVRAMIDVQLLTGMRPGEVCAMTSGALDRSRPIWVYKLAKHKTAHHGHVREVRIGGRAQEILRPFLRLDPDAFLFSPAAAEAERRDQQRDQRATPVPPSQRDRERRSRRRSRHREPGDRYDVASYRRAIARACDQAFPPPSHLARQRVPADGRKAKSLRWETRGEWCARLGRERWGELVAWQGAHRWHPHQLRHTAATRWRREFGAEATLVLLGDRVTKMVDVYAEKDAAKADEIMSRVG